MILVVQLKIKWKEGGGGSKELKMFNSVALHMKIDEVIGSLSAGGWINTSTVMESHQHQGLKSRECCAQLNQLRYNDSGTEFRSDGKGKYSNAPDS